MRAPLRPLARILPARARGEDTAPIEAESRRVRAREAGRRAHRTAQLRLALLGLFFVGAYGAVGMKMAVIAATPPAEPLRAGSAAPFVATRADITDREGRVLATNLATAALYVQVRDLVDPRRAADGLAAVFPDMDADRLHARFTSGARFMWLRGSLSPEQQQAVHDIGDPGLQLGRRERRLYPGGNLAAHVMGGVRFGDQAVDAAEIVGIAGIEAAYDEWLSDPANEGAALRLTLDTPIQAAIEEVLAGAVGIYDALGASAVLMHAETGEIVSIVSLPDFDPNDRPVPLLEGSPDESPLFNRAVQGVYELGSVFKIFPAAQALELGLVEPWTMIDTKGPLRTGGFAVRDFRNYGDELSLTDVMVKSSNIGTGELALMIGPTRQRAFLDTLGMLDVTPVQLQEARRSVPLLPPRWGETASITISYGHGLSVSPVHVAAGYAAMVNGGLLVEPTLVQGEGGPTGARVISEETSGQTRDMLRQIVTRGTASMAEIPGYFLGGKTGTADKPRPTGGYYDDRVIATFAGAFPMHDPEWVIVVTLDEPEETSGREVRRTAGWTAVPVAAEIVSRVAPLLGMAPDMERQDPHEFTRAAHE
ncbi:cell division protein FtsI (penicillin-binding protein 3) [Hasllibacter halocynthiae]|uniref:Cell division protein FtsI (Penicillin-binding protein 3) n=1 Tax=Hasllibacter halocynthiae TaxID=595589 RepID=A0A2T0X792_9RHOB|nr:penicillin-binding protein 2 [Hasllibacter halocynthiae]PRY94821.1 cell division protein FtsI (penicillin-binding protein 3) [Hasllibacter halocynthiae]